MIQAIINAMKAAIEKHGLELLQRYPEDLEREDRGLLERFAHPGMKIAWVVGDSHTHTAPLGVHIAHHKLPTFITSREHDDHLYILTIGRQPGTFSLKEVGRDEFRALSNTRIPYKAVGNTEAFWLYRDESRIGTCIIKKEGTFAKPVWKIESTPMAGITALDREALVEWGGQAVIKAAGTLFAGWTVEWQEPIDLQLAA